MCGILGVISYDGKKFNYSSFLKGLDSISHRGPDDWAVSSLARNGTSRLSRIQHGNDTDSTTVFDESAEAFLGHRRLSILDLTAAGQQPMWTADQKIGLAFNGEIYNYIEIRDDLNKLGYKFFTGTDTEVVLNAYREWGTDCFSLFNGMWAISILDLVRQELIVCRDRLGVKPLYISQQGGRLAFGSEIKALIAASLVQPVADPYIIHEFLVFNQHPVSGRSFIKNVEKMPPGSFRRYSLDSGSCIEDCSWWNIKSTAVSKGEELEAWRDVFFDSVRLRMRSDVSVGACLSGGLDSSAIVSVVNDIYKSKSEFHTFTSCYKDKKHDEREFAQRMVEHVKSSAHWVYPGEETSLLADLDDLVKVQDEPFSTLSIYSQYCVMRLASQVGIKVLLDGQGADELLLGYDNSIAVQNALYLRSGKFFKLAQSISALRRERPNLSTTRLMALISYTGFPFLSAVKNLARTRELLGSVYKVNKSFVSRSKPFPKSLTDARERWVKEHPLPTLLRYEDSNSMAFSIETRLPFLDYRIVNLAFGLSDKAMNKDGWTKFAIRSSMKNLAPKEIIWRKSKMGFPAPTDQFMLDNRSYFAGLFRDNPRSSGFVNAPKLVELFEGGKIEKWHWRFVSLELWMRQFNVLAQ